MDKANPDSMFSLHGQMCTRGNSLGLSQERVDGIKHGADPEFWQNYDRLMRGEYSPPARAATEKTGSSEVVSGDNRFEYKNEFSVVVPEGYDHSTHLDTFKSAHETEFVYYNQNITSKNYANATTKLVAGRRFKVKVFQIKKTVSSVDCLRFLASQKAVLVGAQGASLAYEQGKSELPKNRWSVSFDEKKVLWQGSDRYRRVPCVNRGSGGDFRFDLGSFEDGWRDHSSCLLCFCEE
jgi:hypothetical protein